MTRFRQIGLLVVIAFSASVLMAAGPEASRPPADQKTEVKKPKSIFKAAEDSRRTVFLCDASGSMINKMASLKDQLQKAVEGLNPEQLFGIVFMQDQSCERLDKKLLPATADMKRKCLTFLEGITTTGTTDPIAGLEAAFKLEPADIYLVTDGDFPDNDAVLKKIRELNKDKKVKVHTIAFVANADTDTAFIDLLKTIAKETGGTYEHVNADAL